MIIHIHGICDEIGYTNEKHNINKMRDLFDIEDNQNSVGKFIVEEYDTELSEIGSDTTVVYHIQLI